LTQIDTVAIIAPGDMGHAVGRVLRETGMRVITCLRGRSARTASLAAQAGIADVEDDAALVREADVILSILPPAPATGLARRMAAAAEGSARHPIYADCNAISPATTRAIGDIVTESGMPYVDGGIIGGPPVTGRSGTRLYVSGPEAPSLTCLSTPGLEVRVLSPIIGQASGLKMCYASLTKGLTALATEAVVAGRVLDLDEALRDELRDSQPVLFEWIERAVPSMPPRAGRWVGEMEEIAATFGAVGLSPEMLEGAAAVYRLVGGTALGQETPEKRALGQTVEDVAAILAAALEHESIREERM
jgi:L-threonate 2-dehydrogenase